MNKISSELTETLPWLRSSYCASGGNCVEVMWRRSSRCDGGQCVELTWISAPCDHGQCLEVAFRKATASSDSVNCVEVGPCTCGDGRVLVRDSKLCDDSPILPFTLGDWQDFLDTVKRGHLPWCVDTNGPDVIVSDLADPADPGGPTVTLRFTHAEWDAFVAGAVAGEFDGLVPEAATK